MLSEHHAIWTGIIIGTAENENEKHEILQQEEKVRKEKEEAEREQKEAENSKMKKEAEEAAARIEELVKREEEIKERKKKSLQKAIELQKLRVAAIAEAQESLLTKTKRSNQLMVATSALTAAAVPLVFLGGVAAIPALAGAATLGLAASVTRIVAIFDARKIRKLAKEFNEENKRIIKEALDVGLINLDDDDAVSIELADDDEHQ